jgi:hypothetical protein
MVHFVKGVAMGQSLTYVVTPDSAKAFLQEALGHLSSEDRAILEKRELTNDDKNVLRSAFMSGTDHWLAKAFRCRVALKCVSNRR